MNARSTLGHGASWSRRRAPVQIRLFEPSPHELIEKIRALNLDEMRPMEALRVLADLQKEVS